LGAVRMLTEAALQFDMIDSKSDFSRYRLLVMPDHVPADATLARKIDGFVSGGGSLVASFASGLAPEGDRFALSSLGLRYRGDAPFSPDFLAVKGPLAAGVPNTELVMYLKGKHVEALPGTSVLLDTDVPYFNRTWEHFFSHRHTPSTGKPGYPGVVQNGRSIYFMHPVFSQYQTNAPLWVKRLVVNAIRRLLPEPAVELGAPSSTIAALNQQAAEKRLVLHLLHYIPERRGTAFDVIEDVIPVADVRVRVRTGAAARRVLSVPQGQSIDFRQEGAYVAFVLPKLVGHQMIEIGL
jgi:hypothetical protein